jgi:hypothetical protein
MKSLKLKMLNQQPVDLINQDIESDEEMNDTMILRPQLRHKTLRSSTGIFVLPRDQEPLDIDGHQL